ncbi:MAG: DNA recombination protein RmuC [Planctomycetota bacterium]|nr:DNA recombination protein RmuC [Planctomycetota bacterium]
MDILLGILLVLALLVIILQAYLGRHSSDQGSQGIASTETRLCETFIELSQRDRDSADNAGRALREEVRESLLGTQKIVTENVGQLAKETRELLESTRKQLTDIDQAIATRMQTLQEGNEKKLEQMRLTVDEKLQKTLHLRLTESFQIVTSHLQEVQKGLGEMRSLAENVGGLQRVLTNVKTRGTWGEVQLGAILEDLMAPDQYESNVETIPGSNQRVEFAVKMPGRGTDQIVWLPIDSKFPQEDWMRLQDALDAGDLSAKESAEKSLKRAVAQSASDISEKYIESPHTIDYGIMFLPTEGLYGEVLRLPGLDDELRQKHRVVPAGPTTLAAILGSIRLGFRALAIEQRSAEIWDILAAVKEEFERFESTIGALQKQLATAQNTVDKMGTRSRQMQRKMKTVQDLPEGSKSSEVLGLPDPIVDDIDSSVFDGH